MPPGIRTLKITQVAPFTLLSDLFPNYSLEKKPTWKDREPKTKGFQNTEENHSPVLHLYKGEGPQGSQAALRRWWQSLLLDPLGKEVTPTNVKRSTWLEARGICALPASAVMASRKAGNPCTLEARNLLLITLLEGRETASPYLAESPHLQNCTRQARKEGAQYSPGALGSPAVGLTGVGPWGDRGNRHEVQGIGEGCI